MPPTIQGLSYISRKLVVRRSQRFEDLLILKISKDVVYLIDFRCS
jgi:hypothetical protein